MEVARVMFALIRYEIGGLAISDEIKNLITRDMVVALYNLSKKHDLAHLVGNALDQNGFLEKGSEEEKKFLKERTMAIYRYAQQQSELEQICLVFEKEGIEYIPLKGSVIRNLYKEPWMRTSCDIDILVKEKDLENAISHLEDQLFYKASDKKNYHDVSLFSQSGVHLELHYSLCENMKTIDTVLSKAWEYVKPENSAKKRVFDNTFLVFHLLAHMLYHFKRGGCGVRPLLDLYLLLKETGKDDKLVELLHKCNIEVFFDKIVALSNSWFEGSDYNEETLKIEDYLLSGGVYGTKKNSDLSEIVQSGGKKKRFWAYVFLPYENMVILYPSLKKRKWLLPFYHVYRWITRLFRIKKAVQKSKDILGAEQGEIAEMQDLFDILNI